MNKNNKPTTSLLFAAILATIANHGSYAGGFSLYTESSAAAIGNFAAGIAAEAADASTGWYNPAGLVLLKKQEMVFSGVGVFPSSTISGTSTYITKGIHAPYVQSFNNLQGANNAGVPAFHYAKPLGDRAAFGFSIVSPFGLSTDWGTKSPVRYYASYSDLMLIDASPEISGKLTDNLSVGLGLDLQWTRITFNGVLGAPALLQALPHNVIPPTAFDSTSENKGSSFGVGFHAGVMSMFNDNHTRIGLNYQSGVSHTFTGNSTLTGRLADPKLTNPNAKFYSDVLSSNVIQLPAIVTLSGYHDVTEQAALLGSVVYSAWSKFKDIELQNIAGYSTETTDQALINLTTLQNYRNSWRFALGGNYHVNDQWMMRVGGGYDQTPTINAQRDVRLPDSNRWALSIGAHYQMRYNVGFDVGYSYLFGSNHSTIDKVQVLDAESTNIINAIAKPHAQLFGLQVVWGIDQPQVVSTK